MHYRFLLLALSTAALAACSTPAPQPAQAIAKLQATSGSKVSGDVKFTQKEGQQVMISAVIYGLKPNSEHGFHIHDKGDCSGDGNAAGGHFNPTGAMHGAPGHGHAGDLPMLQADAQGTATVRYTSQQIKLEGEGGILGRAVIVHRDLDDQHTQPTGNAGPRLACGVIMTGG